ncbi:hypothetical protein GCM10022419_002360 [Nonomuraea rosea]|uniref:Uncharacterized protein n=1 Tax=Nonomuraea rosea TaxID=638574 RepID=A0ABP6V1Q7_9ACTN
MLTGGLAMTSPSLGYRFSLTTINDKFGANKTAVVVGGHGEHERQAPGSPSPKIEIKIGKHPRVGRKTQGQATVHADLRLLANPIEAHFGPLRQSPLANSDHPLGQPTTGTRRLKPPTQPPGDRFRSQH